jgi:hypothetical protein
MFILSIEKLCPTHLNNDQHFQNNASLMLQAIFASLTGTDFPKKGTSPGVKSLLT